MKKKRNLHSLLKFLLLAFPFTLSPLCETKADHLIGGELTYACQGNDFYLIKLKVFRDCACINCAFFDNPAYVFIYDDFGTAMDILEMTFPAPVPLSYDPTINPCLELPPGLCVEEAVYTELVYLPPIAGGYHIVHQRCCRNNSILNITSPNSAGATFYAQIPDPSLATCNSDPYFSNFPPIALCINDSFVFDHSAIDADGDSLVYELCAPYSGADQGNPKPDPGSPPPPPPYGFVAYEPAYSYDAPLNGSPPMQIDPQTGVLTCTPSTIGQFVVGVCVNEYRNGMLLSSNKRDFQFNVVNCNAVITAALPAYLLNCDDSVSFINNTTGGTFYLWDFGDGGTDTAEAPVHAYQDTGLYNVSLIVNSGWPCTDTATMEVNVLPELKASYSFVMHCSDSAITFNDLSTSVLGAITDWSWSFGDGVTSTEQSPSHNYSQGGVYNLQLSVTNDTGCVDIKSQEIYVYEEPQTLIFYNSVCKDSLITFNDDTELDSGAVISWNWDIAGLASGTDSAITHTFDQSGVYTITLSVVTDNGCQGTAAQTIVIDSCFVVGAGNFQEPDGVAFTVTPNPGGGVFTVKFLNEQASAAQLCVYDHKGSRVLAMDHCAHNQSINLQPFGPGLYFLRMLKDESSYTIKVIEK